MKRFVLATIVLLCSSAVSFAQQDPADSPATKEDVQRYLEVMHSREMMSKIIEAMTKPMHQMMHEQYEKDKDKLPADFETRMNKLMDDTMKSFPWDEMLDSMVPVYQKHFRRHRPSGGILFHSHRTKGHARTASHHCRIDAIDNANYEAKDRGNDAGDATASR
jgi:hypothetical protein